MTRDEKEALAKEIVQFVYGLRGPRQTDISTKQIMNRFSLKHPSSDIHEAIDYAWMVKGWLNVGSHQMGTRTYNAATYYDCAERGC